MDFENTCKQLRTASRALAMQNAKQKNDSLLCVAKSIDAKRHEIIEANALDVENSRKNGMKESLVDRLMLNDKRIDGIINSIKVIALQTDPVGQSVAGWTSPVGLKINQIRVPLGVCAIIYESRPNVTVDSFALAYKSGNAILLRGSSSALYSNKALVSAIKLGLSSSEFGLVDAVALADSGERSEVQQILEAKGKIDVVLPRGGANLIKMVVECAKIPVIETGSGVCHLFVDESADLQNAAKIAANAKLTKPGACNAIETILVHKNIAKEFLPMMYKEFAGRSKFRCCEKSIAIMQDVEKELGGNVVSSAVPEDFGTEFLDYILAVKIVNDIDEALSHISVHSTKHSESIITSNVKNATRFQREVDAACVYVNTSTRFTDGEEFGFGAELGISTQKMHVRGPMGLQALTTTKYLIESDGLSR